MQNIGQALGGVVGPREWDSEDVHDLVELLLAEANQAESASDEINPYRE